MTLIEQAEAMAERLLEPCLDWDGNTMVDGAEPRRIPSCGELRQAAALIRRMADELRKAGEYVDIERLTLGATPSAPATQQPDPR